MTANTAKLLALSGCALLSAGCSREAAPTGDRATAVPIKAVAERYPLTGEVLRVEPERKVLIVRHDEIKDYMPAMTMEFLVSDGDLALARPG